MRRGVSSAATETCNFDFSDQFTAGWKYTFQVPRADFDKTLADAVAARGVEILYGHGVTAVNFERNRRDRDHRATPDGNRADMSRRGSCWIAAVMDGCCRGC